MADDELFHRVVHVSTTIRLCSLDRTHPKHSFLPVVPRHSFRRPLKVAGRPVVLETLSLSPLVLSVERFLSDADCDHVIASSEPHMAASGVSLMDKDKGKAATEFRTSTTHFLPSTTPEVAAIDTRVANLTRTPVSHQEFVQVLRYGHTQHYGAHTDYWDPALYQDPREIERIEGGAKNRLATVFWCVATCDHGARPRRARSWRRTAMKAPQDFLTRSAISLHF